MKKTILNIALMLGSCQLLLAQKNQITMPFINVALTGACDSTVTMKVRNNQLVYDGSTAFKLNANNFLSKLISYDTNGVDLYNITVYYNANNKADSATSSIRVGTSTFNSVSRITYDGNGYVIAEASLMQLIPGVYDSSEAHFYTYDGTGKMLTSTRRSKNSGSMKWRDKYVFTYNGNGKVTKQEEYTYNDGTSVWDLTNQADFTYDGNGNKIEELRISYPGPVNNYRETITYNASNRRLVRFYEIYSSGWLPTGKDSTYYLANNNGFNFSYTYTNGNYELTKKDTCVSAGLPSSIKNIATGTPLTLYPNPANTTVRLTVNSNTSSTVMISDLNGKVVPVQMVFENNEWAIPANRLQAGVYLVRVTQGTEITNLKLIITH
jgi:hypothetical protein